MIGTPVGGTIEVLDDLDDNPAIPLGMLASAADAHALAERMFAWASLPDDGRRALGETCRTYALERFTWERTATAVESFYAGYV